MLNPRARRRDPVLTLQPVTGVAASSGRSSAMARRPPSAAPSSRYRAAAAFCPPYGLRELLRRRHWADAERGAGRSLPRVRMVAGSALTGRREPARPPSAARSDRPGRRVLPDVLVPAVTGAVGLLHALLLA